MALNGIYVLQSCPAGYELVAQQCSLCPAASYCKGGTATHTQCQDGLFSPPGSKTLSDCVPVVFVVTYTTFPVFINEFATVLEGNLTTCLATVSGVVPRNILEVSISEAGFGNTLVIMKLATSDELSAAYVKNKLLDNLSNPSLFATLGLPGCVLLSVTVTACTPGFKLVLGSGVHSIGSDGQCEICPAGYYCVGGSTYPTPCSEDSFSLPGSNSSSACAASVFIVVVVTISLPASNFTGVFQQAFISALAASGGCDVDRVLIVSILSLDQVRRASGGVKVQSQIAVPDLNAATDVQNRLGASSLNVQLAARGIPASSLDSVSVLASSAQDSTIQPWVIVLAVVGSLLVLLLAALVAVRALRSKGESQEEATVRQKIVEIRQILRLMPGDGFVLNTERWPFWDRWRDVVVLRWSHLEAAARMALFQDFDVLQFNAFCVSLEGETDAASTERYASLCKWLLELSEKLIYPEIEAPKKNFSWNASLTFSFQTPEGMPASERFRFFQRKVAKAKIWLDDADLFSNLKQKAEDLMEKIAKLCEIRYLELVKEAGGQELVEVEKSLQEQSGGKWCRKGTSLLRTFLDELPLLRTSDSGATTSPTSAKDITTDLPSTEDSRPPNNFVVRQDHVEVILCAPFLLTLVQQKKIPSIRTGFF